MDVNKQIYFIIYKITNLIDSKFYIGAHITDDLNDEYMGSGIRISRAIEKYGKENFKKEIIHFCKNKQELYIKEKEIITNDFLKRTDIYNLKSGGFGGWHSKGKVSVRDKDGKIFNVNKTDPRYISGELVPIAKNTVVVKDKNGNKFCVNSNDPRYISGELVHNLVGTKRSEEAKLKTSKTLKGRKKSEEWKLKISQARKGFKHSEETKRKISLYWKNHNMISDWT